MMVRNWARMARRKLPEAVYSSQGPIPVVVADDLEERRQAHGEFIASSRVIEINGEDGNATQIQTLCHEMLEVALWDSGIHNILDHNVKEAVCDAAAAYLAAAVRAGFIRLTIPNQ
jgi:hypothetical protein